MKKANDEKRKLDLIALESNFDIILGDFFESIIGAVLIDSMDVDIAYEITIRLLREYYNSYGSPTSYYEHPKCEFFELMQKNKDIKYKIRRHFVRDMKEEIYIPEFIGGLNGVIVSRVETDGHSKLHEKQFFNEYLNITRKIVEEYNDRVKSNIR